MTNVTTSVINRLAGTAVPNWGDGKISESIWNRIIPEPNSGCWLWIGSTGKLGYGKLTVAGRSKSAHRCIYLIYYDIADGLELDHLCKVRCCVNPAHLEPVTHVENVRRGDISLYREKARMTAKNKTHCKNRHLLDENNTYINSNGCKLCRICTNRPNSLRHKLNNASKKEDVTSNENKCLAY